MDNMSKSSNGYVQTITLPKGEQYSDDVQLQDFAATVAPKWQGTLADKHDMVMLGRSQVLRVSIHLESHHQTMPSLNNTNCSGISASFPSLVSPPFSSAPGSSSSREHTNQPANLGPRLIFALLATSSSLLPMEAQPAFSGDSLLSSLPVSSSLAVSPRWLPCN